MCDISSPITHFESEFLDDGVVAHNMNRSQSSGAWLIDGHRVNDKRRSALAPERPAVMRVVGAALCGKSGCELRT